MKTIFRSVFYLRSNYINKDGKTPVMLRIYLNNERVSIGSTGISVLSSKWDNNKERLKGRTTESLEINLQLDNIQRDLQNIFNKLDNSNDISLERIKSEYLGNKDDVSSIITLFDKFNNDLKKRVGLSIGVISYKRYELCKKYFIQFLKIKYNRSDLKFSELTYIIIHDFETYLRTVIKQNHNTAAKTIKMFKTVTIWGRKLGILHHDPFINYRIHFDPVNRGFLTDEEVKKIMKKEIKIPRLELVRDMFIFSCFTGLAYIDVANLTPDNIVTMNDREWLMTKRAKTDIETNILLTTEFE